MSRSRRALQEAGSTESAIRGPGNPTRDGDGSRGLGRSCTQLKLTTVTCVMVIALTSAPALAKAALHQPAAARTNASAAVRATRSGERVLALGPHAGDHASAAVRALQRRLIAAGYSPGPVDGFYGPLTERAIISFQVAQGLPADGIAGPRTLAALAHPLLRRGVGYAAKNGSTLVRRLQRELTAAGYGPGPLDGLYGPRTERAVIRFQAGHDLPVNGIAGPRTVAALRSRAPRATIRPTRTPVPPSGSITPSPVPAPGGHNAASSARGRTTQSRHAHGFSPAEWIGLIAALAVAGLGAAFAWSLASRRSRARRAGSGISQPRPAGPDSSHAIASGTVNGGGVNGQGSHEGRIEFDRAAALERLGDIEGAVAAYRQADRLGQLGAACNLGVLLEQQGDLEGAEGAYRRSAQSGDVNGVFNLAGLLEGRGSFDEAIAMYVEADRLGHPAAARELGLVLRNQGDLDGAEAAYRRADARGDASGAFSLGRLLEYRGEVKSALAAYQRAVEYAATAAANAGTPQDSASTSVERYVSVANATPRVRNLTLPLGPNGSARMRTWARRMTRARAGGQFRVFTGNPR